MGRKPASLPTDRSVAETRGRRGDSRQARRRVDPPRAQLADVAKVVRRRRHPTRQSHASAIEVNKTFPQVIDDFSHPIPVRERELDAIEMYLGPLIDKILQDME